MASVVKAAIEAKAARGQSGHNRIRAWHSKKGAKRNDVQQRAKGQKREQKATKWLRKHSRKCQNMEHYANASDNLTNGKKECQQSQFMDLAGGQKSQLLEYIRKLVIYERVSCERFFQLGNELMDMSPYFPYF